jgi:hypothetical protein
MCFMILFDDIGHIVGFLSFFPHSLLFYCLLSLKIMGFL